MIHSYRTRFAPSPTGRLHLGHARTALVGWLRARSAGGAFVMRMEDLDTARVRPGAAEGILEDLRWLGLDWDEGPDVGGAFGPYLQSERLPSYAEALAELERRGLVYPCTCTRKELREIASAPHGETGPRYPGFCRQGPRAPERPPSLRFRLPDAELSFVDRLAGPRSGESEDLVLRRADGLFAYQLAVVVDDDAMEITEVVRGDDLLPSTPGQIALYRALGRTPPDFLHVPLVVGSDGARLAKRHGSVSLADLRAERVAPEQLVAWLAESLGFPATRSLLRPPDLVESFALARVPTAPVVFGAPGDVAF